MHCSTDSLPLSAVLYKMVHEQEQCDTSALGKSKNLMSTIYCVTVLQNIVHCMVE
jgi:hypothetical protein